MMNNDRKMVFAGWYRPAAMGMLFYLFFSLIGCAGFGDTARLEKGVELPPSLRPPATQGEEADKASGEVTEIPLKAPVDTGEATGFKPTPSIPQIAEPTAAPPRKKPPALAGPKATVNFEGLPLPAFINAIYGDILKIPFEIDSGLQGKRDLVSLRAQEPLPPDEIDGLARQVLQNYGVAAEQQGAVLRFFPAKSAPAGEPPLLVSGRALPEVPISHRPIFQLVPLKTVRNVHVSGWLKQAYKGQPLEISEDPERNAILLMGPPELVEQALEATRFLDQPYLRGSHSVRIEPVFLGAQELAEMLVNVLNAEGYSASLKGPLGSVMILPLTVVNAVLVFTADEAIMEHVKQWAASLDKPGQVQSSGTRIFYYVVKNTRAADIAIVLDKMLSGTDVSAKGTLPTQNRPAEGATGPAAVSHSPAAANPLLAQKLVVDEVRNGLIFQGNTNEWEVILPVIREMDRPTRMVLIEVTVAEVTLTDKEEFGIEWLLRDAQIGNVNLSGGTNFGLAQLVSGLSFKLDNAGQTQAMLHAFASKQRVKILSCPRIMVKSGAEAQIDVGTEVPIVTSQGTSSELQQDGTSAILQQIQYRKTGALLSVKPVIHSGNRIDLEISQEVSEVPLVQDAASEIPSPSIFSRKITTSMGLQDGGSVLLGGLISTSGNSGRGRVPFLSDIPLLGRLFSADNMTQVRTEMLMLIVPYVISDNEEAIGVTESLKAQFPNALAN